MVCIVELQWLFQGKPLGIREGLMAASHAISMPVYAYSQTVYILNAARALHSFVIHSGSDGSKEPLQIAE